MRGIQGPSKSGGGWLANIEATPYNLSRCPMRGPQVARESGTAGEPQPAGGELPKMGRHVRSCAAPSRLEPVRQSVYPLPAKSGGFRDAEIGDWLMAKR